MDPIKRVKEVLLMLEGARREVERNALAAYRRQDNEDAHFCDGKLAGYEEAMRMLNNIIEESNRG